jgi:hypothetical protein
LVFRAGARVEKPGTGPQTGNLDTARTSACATPAARTWNGHFVTSPKCHILLAPTMGAVTPGCCKIHASPTCALPAPRSSLLDRAKLWR